LGRLALFVPGPIVTLMFPKSVGNFALGRDSSGLLRKSLGAVLLLSIPIVATMFVIPTLVAHFSFGTTYSRTAPLIGPYALVMASSIRPTRSSLSCSALSIGGESSEMACLSAQSPIYHTAHGGRSDDTGLRLQR